jgi:hypothetical protein
MRTLTVGAMVVFVGFGAAGVGAAERDVLRTDRLAAPEGTRVVVDAATVDVVVRTGDVPDVEVTTELSISGVGEAKAEDWVARHTPTLSEGDDEVRVTVAPGRDGFMGLGMLTAKARLGLVVPTHAVPDLTTTGGSISVRGDFPAASPLRLRTSTGSVEFTGGADSIDVRSSSGDARLVVVRPLDRIFARTAAGDVDLEGGAREATVDTASGDVFLSGLSGSADVITSTGDITLRWDRLDPSVKVRVRSTSGRVHLVLPEAVRPRGTLTTTGGSIRSDFPGIVNEAGDTIELAGDGPRLEVETASGEIVVSHAVGWEGAVDAEPTPTPVDPS